MEFPLLRFLKPKKADPLLSVNFSALVGVATVYCVTSNAENVQLAKELTLKIESGQLSIGAAIDLFLLECDVIPSVVNWSQPKHATPASVAQINAHQSRRNLKVIVAENGDEHGG